MSYFGMLRIMLKELIRERQLQTFHINRNSLSYKFYRELIVMLSLRRGKDVSIKAGGMKYRIFLSSMSLNIMTCSAKIIANVMNQALLEPLQGFQLLSHESTDANLSLEEKPEFLDDVQ